jgi:hypothetical protein
VQEPLNESTPVEQESIDVRQFEEIHQLFVNSPGVGAATCQVCGSPLREGETVAAYVFRRCPHAVWLVGQLRCAEHAPDLESLASLGVREVVVTGRVGTCSDQATQRSWPVLLAPKVQAVSPAATVRVRSLPGVTITDITECPVARAALDTHPVLGGDIPRDATRNSVSKQWEMRMKSR